MQLAGKIRVGLTSHKGRMAQLIAGAVKQSTTMTLVGAYSRSRYDADCYHSFEQLVIESDLLVDFSHPDLTLSVIQTAVAHQKPLFIGTTGLDDHCVRTIHQASCDIPILYTSNTTIGISILLKLVEKVADLLNPSYDIEINESHHRHKIDAPSGTALSLGEAAAKGRQIDFFKHAVLSRQGHTDVRTEGSIGFSCIRGGNIPGEHTVKFIGHDEMIELKHTTFDRSALVSGVLKGIVWLSSQKPGLYAMTDVLNMDG